MGSYVTGGVVMGVGGLLYHVSGGSWSPGLESEKITTLLARLSRSQSGRNPERDQKPPRGGGTSSLRLGVGGWSLLGPGLVFGPSRTCASIKDQLAFLALELRPKLLGVSSCFDPFIFQMKEPKQEILRTHF